MSQPPKESSNASRNKSSLKRNKTETDNFAEDKFELEVSGNESKSAREAKSRKRSSSSNNNCRKKKRKHQEASAPRKKPDKAMTSSSSMMSRVDVDYAPPLSHYRAMTSSQPLSSCSKKPPKRSSVISVGSVDVVRKKKSFETKQNGGSKKSRPHSESAVEKVSMTINKI